jgi:hypothetical protein
MMSDEKELTKVHLNLPNHRAVGGESVQLDLIDLLETAMPPSGGSHCHWAMISHGNGLLILRPAVASERPAKWYLEDGVVVPSPCFDASSRIRSRGARPGHILGSFLMNALASSVRALNC